MLQKLMGKTISASRGQKHPDNFGEMFAAKAKLGKYLKKEC